MTTQKKDKSSKDENRALKIRRAKKKFVHFVLKRQL